MDVSQALVPWPSHALRRLAGCMAWLLIFLGGATFSHAVGATAPHTWVIDKAELSSLAGRREVTLPHILEPQDYLPAGSRVRYRMTLPLSQLPPTQLGVFVNKMSLSGALYINGQFSHSCDQGQLEELRCLHKVNLFAPPPGLWYAGDNIIEVEIYATERQMNGLSKVQVGDLVELHDGAFWMSQWLKSEFLSGLAWVSAVLGFLSLAVSLVLRKESAYLWFGIAAIAHALSLLNLTVSNPVVSVDVFTWMVFSSRLVATPMGLLTMLSLFDKLRRWMVLVLVGFAVVGPMLLLLSGNHRPVMIAFFLPFFLAAMVLLVVSVRWAIQSRNPIKLITIGMALILVLSGMVDWLRLTGRADFEGGFLFPYTYSAMLMTMGTLLFRNLATALKQSRIDRELLEMRAAERMAYEVTENIPVGTYTLVYRPGVKRGKFLFVSQRFLELTGLDRQSILADPQPLLDILHVDDWAAWRQLITRSVDQRDTFSMEFRISHFSGEMRWVSTEAVARTLPDGAVLYEGVLIDQTAMVYAKREAESARATLLKQQLEQSRLQEREQLMRDMHDGFGSQLAGVRMLAEKGRIRPEEFPQFLHEITADLHLVVDTLGQLHITLDEALIDLRHRLERRFSGNGPRLHWDSQLAGLPALPQRQILQTLRLIQEAFNNAFKHARAQNVWFSAHYDAPTDVLTVSVRDDGHGLQLPKVRGRGLNNMQYRAREIGGKFQLIERHPGVEVILQVPHVWMAAQTDST